MVTRDSFIEDNFKESIAAFADCGWDEAISAVDHKGYLYMASPLRSAASKSNEEGKHAQAKILHLLAEVCEMVLSPKSSNKPFEPNWEGVGYRSTLPEDFTESEVDFFAQVFGLIDNGFLRGRLADLVWLRQQPRDLNAALTAIDSYTSLQLDPETWTLEAELCWERAIILARMLGGGAGTRLAQIETSIVQVIKDADREDTTLIQSLSELLKANRLGINDAIAIAEKLELVAGELETVQEFDRARTFYNDAAIWFRNAGNDSKSIAMTVAEAEALANLANYRVSNENPSYGVAASFLQEAVQVYRSIPRAERDAHKVNERIKELWNELNETGGKAMDQMVTVGTSSSDLTDLTDLVELAHESVRGKEPAEALKAFANLHHTSARKLRDAAEKILSNGSIRSHIPTVFHADDGRVIAKHPGLSGQTPSEDDEIVIQAEMAGHYSYLINVVVYGLIAPALDVLNTEHRLRETDFIEVARLSPIVPAGRERLFGKALYHGYDRDFATALHLLAPQIEHLVRFHLKQVGALTTHLDPKGIETENGLSTLIDLPEAVDTFGEDLTYEIRTLFCEQTGPNFRNNVAHGLVDDQQSESVASVYAWWFGMKLVFNSLTLLTSSKSVTDIEAGGQQASSTEVGTQIAALDSLSP